MMRNFTVLLVVVIASCTAVQGEFILDAYMHDAMYGGIRREDGISLGQ